MEQQQPPKPPRAPSAYNRYIKAKIAELKAAGETTGSLLKAAAEAYKAEVTEVASAIMADPGSRLPPRGRAATAEHLAKKKVLEPFAA